MQTILGAGGAIGKDLAAELSKYTAKIRLVSRNPEKVNETDELFPADLADPQQVDTAIEGSDVVYLTVGFPYQIKVWQNNWPALMKSTLDACKRHGSKLVFFDNIYMYDRDYLSHITEETPIRPTSKKGQVRALVAGMLLEASQKGDVSALIARAPDFYGPRNSVLTEMAIKNLIKGKKANWLVDVDKVHNFIFTPDAAKATALLGNTPDAYHQVWHLPTTHEKFTVREWIKMHAEVLGREPRISVMPSWLVGLMGVFIPILGEFKEMLYQYDRDYYFDSSKFEKRFGISATSPYEGIRSTIQNLTNS